MTIGVNTPSLRHIDHIDSCLEVHVDTDYLTYRN